MMPGTIVFETFTGALEFGGESFVTLRDLALDGEETALRAQGTVGMAAKTDLRPLDIELTVEKLEANMKMVMRAMGTRLAANGPTQIHIGGTLGNPQIR